MIISAMQKFSMIDFPGKLSAILFTQGCNFRCPYCHNPELISSKAENIITEEEIFDFLKSRINKLDAVVITGGEPTLHSDLPDFIAKIKDLGFLIKLDTNGTNPDLLQEIIDRNIVDYIAMDIKGPIDEYSKFVNADICSNDIISSLNLIRDSGSDYEFRTTIVKGLHSLEHILGINKVLQKRDRFFIQNFVDTKTLAKRTIFQAFSKKECDFLVNEFYKNKKIVNCR